MLVYKMFWLQRVAHGSWIYRVSFTGQRLARGSVAMVARNLPLPRSTPMPACAATSPLLPTLIDLSGSTRTALVTQQKVSQAWVDLQFCFVICSISLIYRNYTNRCFLLCPVIVDFIFVCLLFIYNNS